MEVSKPLGEMSVVAVNPWKPGEIRLVLATAAAVVSHSFPPHRNPVGVTYEQS